MGSSIKYYKNDDVRRRGDEFSITSKLADYIGNPEWREGYDNLQRGEDINTDNNFLWHTMSAANEEIGAKLYERINNYINNLSNIDTAEFHSLDSMATLLGVESELNLLNFSYPQEILDLLNVFSVNKDLLLKSTKMLTPTSRETLISELSGVPETFSLKSLKDRLVIDEVAGGSINGEYLLTSGTTLETDALYINNSDYQILHHDIPSGTIVSQDEAWVDGVWILKNDNDEIIASSESLSGTYNAALRFNADDTTTLPDIETTFYNTYCQYNNEDVWISNNDLYELFSNIQINTYPLPFARIHNRYIIKYINSNVNSYHYEWLDIYGEWLSFISPYSITISGSDKSYLNNTYELNFIFIGRPVYIYKDGLDQYVLQPHTHAAAWVIHKNGTPIVAVNSIPGVYNYPPSTGWLNYFSYIPDPMVVSYDTDPLDLEYDILFDSAYIHDILNEYAPYEENAQLLTDKVSIDTTDIPALSSLSPFEHLISQNITIETLSSLSYDSDIYSSSIYKSDSDDTTWILSGMGVLSANSYSFEATALSSEYNPPLTGWTCTSFDPNTLSGDITPSYLTINNPLPSYDLPTSDNQVDITILEPLSATSETIIDDALYTEKIYNIFYDTLYALCNLEYHEYELGFKTDNTSADTTGIIWKNILTDLQSNLFKDLNSNDEDILQAKIKYSIPLSFKEKFYVDQINQNLIKLSDFNGAEQAIIQMEYDRRAEKRLKREPVSRYAQSRENKVKEIFRFILLFNDVIGKNFEEYVVDPRFFEVTGSHVEFITDAAGEIKGVTLDNSLIVSVAKKLTDIAIKSSYLRETLKKRAQKNHLGGTYLLLKTLIREYLYYNVYNKINQKENYWRLYNDASILSGSITPSNDLDIKLIEYSDPTEYYNIAQTSEAVSGDLNDRYWETYGSTSFDVSGDYLPSFTSTQLSTFYGDQLAFEFVSGGGLEDFLDCVFNAGATSATVTNSLPTSSDQYKLFNRYASTLSATTPYYNYKNTIHPSYQLHPYLAAFTEIASIKESVDDLYNYSYDATDALLSADISDWLDDKGNIINYWKEGRFDFTGYSSRYEIENNENKLSVVNRYIDREGAYIPEALDALLADSNLFTNGYYDHLTLTSAEETFIKLQLSRYSSSIKALAGKIITKYGEDRYGNSLILFKDTDDRDERGQLWMRIKDHPLPFPAFELNDAESDLREECQYATYSSRQHSSIIEALKNATGLDAFFDFDLNTTHDWLTLVYQNRSTTAVTDASYYYRANATLGKLDKVFNYSGGYYQYQFNKDKTHNFESPTILSDSGNDQWHFIGMYKKKASFGFIQQKIDSVNGLNDADSSIITDQRYLATFKLTTFNAINGVTNRTFTVPVDYNIYLGETTSVREIRSRCSASDSLMTIAFESNPPIADVDISNYIEYTTNTDQSVVFNKGLTKYGNIASYNNDNYKLTTYNTLITSIDFDISDNVMPTDFDNVQYFSRHTDAKHLPLYPGSNGSMRLWNNPVLSLYDEYYIQYIGQGADGQEGMIWEDTLSPVSELSGYQHFDVSAISADSLSGLSAVYQYTDEYDYLGVDPDTITPSTLSGTSLNDDLNNYGTFEYDDGVSITVYYTEINSIIDQVVFREGTPESFRSGELILDVSTTSGTLVCSSQSYDITLTDTTLSKIKFNITRS